MLRNLSMFCATVVVCAATIGLSLVTTASAEDSILTDDELDFLAAESEGSSSSLGFLCEWFGIGCPEPCSDTCEDDGSNSFTQCERADGETGNCWGYLVCIDEEPPEMFDCEGYVEAEEPGCDGVAGSGLEIDDCGECGGNNASMDICGVCNGDGTSCENSSVTPTPYYTPGPTPAVTQTPV